MYTVHETQNDKFRRLVDGKVKIVVPTALLPEAKRAIGSTVTLKLS